MPVRSQCRVVGDAGGAGARFGQPSKMPAATSAKADNSDDELLAGMRPSRPDADAESRRDVVDQKALGPQSAKEAAAFESVAAAALGVGDVVYIEHNIDNEMVWYDAEPSAMLI